MTNKKVHDNAEQEIIEFYDLPLFQGQLPENNRSNTKFGKDIVRQYKNKDIEKFEKEFEALSNKAVQLATRMARKKLQICSPSEAWKIMSPILSSKDKEELWTINFDRKYRALSFTQLYMGSVNQAQVRIGEIFRVPILDMCSAIILVHNHPSGDPTPSPDDIKLTKAVFQAGQLLDIELTDHLVIGYDKFVSMKERNLGFS